MGPLKGGEPTPTERLFREIRWVVSEGALDDVNHFREAFGEEEYGKLRDQVKEILAGYFVAEPVCGHDLGRSVRSLGGGKGGFKRFKVRLQTPTGGSRTGLRLGYSVDCAAKEVRLAWVKLKREEPGDAWKDEQSGNAEA